MDYGWILETSQEIGCTYTLGYFVFGTQYCNVAPTFRSSLSDFVSADQAIWLCADHIKGGEELADLKRRTAREMIRRVKEGTVK